MVIEAECENCEELFVTQGLAKHRISCKRKSEELLRIKNGGAPLPVKKRSKYKPRVKATDHAPCDYCGRIFLQRGLRNHKNACKRKHENSRGIRPVPNFFTPIGRVTPEPIEVEDDWIDLNDPADGCSIEYAPGPENNTNPEPPILKDDNPKNDYIQRIVKTFLTYNPKPESTPGLGIDGVTPGHNRIDGVTPIEQTKTGAT